MLEIRAVSFKGGPVGRDLVARFGEGGGTIGRGESSTLLLPDPERYISRIHAMISFQAGGFVLTDKSTKNPLILNGKPIGPGGQVRLAHGDEIKLGAYILQVAIQDSPAPQARLPKDDPLAVFGAPGSKTPDPFADLLAPPQKDPFDQPRRVPVDAGPMSPPRAEPPHPDPLAGLQPRDPGIDELLDLKPSPRPLDPFEVEPKGNRPFLPPDVLVDPLEVLGRPPRQIPPPTAPDHGQEVHTPYIPPVAKLDPLLEPTRVEPIIPPRREPSVPSAGPAASGRQEAALGRAFLEGAGITDPRLVSSLTPDTMAAIGRLVREAVQGTLDLLRARSLTKREMRADVTAIMPADNNPLKFSPTVESALGHLLTPSEHGFMPPARAMKEAYDDLRAHQLGFLAGMRAALEEVLAQFAPEELRKKLSEPGMLDSVLSASRKAKQWDLFVERYEEVAAEAREGFNAAFGRAFRRAYEEQVKQLRAEDRRG